MRGSLPEQSLGLSGVLGPGSTPGAIVQERVLDMGVTSLGGLCALRDPGRKKNKIFWEM